MKKDKLTLNSIKIESFQTSERPQNLDTIKGGNENSNCRTQCFIGCQSAQDSGCNSCGGGTTGGGTGQMECGTYEIISCYEPCN